MAATPEAIPEMTFGHFSGRVGRTFEVKAGGHCLPLVLDAAQELPGSRRPGGAFRLEFLGPLDPVLDQGMFAFEINRDRFEIFIVAIARDPRGTRYEAVFF